MVDRARKEELRWGGGGGFGLGLYKAHQFHDDDVYTRYRMVFDLHKVLFPELH